MNYSFTVGNKWIRQNLQIFRRPCGLEIDHPSREVARACHLDAIQPRDIGVVVVDHQFEGSAAGSGGERECFADEDAAVMTLHVLEHGGVIVVRVAEALHERAARHLVKVRG